MSWVTYLFPEVNKATPMSRLAPSIDWEILERISASTSSYTTESNEDTFKSDTIFESFHHQARILMSDRDLLASGSNADAKSHPVTDSNSHPLVKTPNPRVKLP